MRKSIIRQVLTASLLLLPVPAALNAQTCPDVTKLTAGLNGPIATVRFLADDALGGRMAGSPGERCAGDYIAARFAALGLKPAGDSGTFFQAFDLASVINPHAPKGIGRNVVAILEGSDPQLRGEYIVIGAHYDHLGMGAFGSTSGDTTPAIHNGADDNASGVAALLEVAERLTRSGTPARSVVFIAFSGEESGLIGSAFYANHPHTPLTQARAMLNMDMVGRLGKGPLIVYGVGTANEWPALVKRTGEKHDVDLTLVGDGFGASDHTSFYMKDVPVLHFFSNVHSDYHKPSDDWEKIDAPGLLKVSDVITDIAREIAGTQTTLTLIKGAGRPPGAAPSRGSGAYLGTIPDFTPVPKGVKISGVRAGGPGDTAGLKGGDIIIRFDNDDIADLQGMTDALNKRKPGDTVKVAVIRDGNELVLTATLGKR
jgi:acetylornithine deacetylase/succinyl-diaminopimelate desuccinylase-like protein